MAGNSLRPLCMFLGIFLLAAPFSSASADSLWLRGTSKQGPRSLYDSERIPEKKFKKNDLILVEENGFAANNSNINLRRKFDLEAELREWADFDAGDFKLRAADPTTLPLLNLQSEKRQEGRGTTDRRGSPT